MRVSVYDGPCAEAVRALVDASPVPLVADIHFDHRLAIRSVENGVAKVRINPGNIGGEENVRRLADCVKAHHVPVRVGVNAGSLEKELLQKYGGPTASALVESALNQARMLEGMGVEGIVLSLKASSVRTTVDACRLAAASSDYPLHLGVTEAGTPEAGTVKSAVGIGSLLLDGIGDTIRVSLSGPPELEVPVCLSILRAVGLRDEGVEVISCPTCGRCGVDLVRIASEVEAALRPVESSMKKKKLPSFSVAVMGCAVNGPGEAKEADYGVACGKGKGLIFRHGEIVKTVQEEDIAKELILYIEQEKTLV